MKREFPIPSSPTHPDDLGNTYELGDIAILRFGLSRSRDSRSGSSL